EATKSWVKMPMRHYDLASIYPDDEARTPNTRTDITSSGPMAAVIGFQSPYNEATKSWVKMPMRHYDLASIYPDDEARTPNTRT
ncbi:hypothetical protein CKQ90_33550, partial [Klebsiella pneumoniae]